MPQFNWYIFKAFIRVIKFLAEKIIGSCGEITGVTLFEAQDGAGGVLAHINSTSAIVHLITAGKVWLNIRVPIEACITRKGIGGDERNYE